MRRKVSMCLGIALALIVLTGCETLDFWKEDSLGHYSRFRSQLNSMHKFVDRHFFDYNWDDPLLDR